MRRLKMVVYFLILGILSSLLGNEKYDFLLENGRHRSSKMWYCRLYNIMMLQHLDAWDLPYESTLQKLILQTA